MAGLLSSPRKRRRALWTVTLAAVAATVGFVVWKYPNTASDAYDATPVNRNEPIVAEPDPVRVPLEGERRAAALGAAQRFLVTAVARRDVAASWPVTHPTLRSGYTRREWASGDIPVVPYPVATARWRLDYSFADRVGMQVYVVPKEGADVREMVFDIELTAQRRGDDERWLVSEWSPRGGAIYQPPPANPEREAAVAREMERRRANEIPVGWLLAPVGVILALMTVPILFTVRDWRRNRRADRRHRAELAREDERRRSLNFD